MVIKLVTFSAVMKPTIVNKTSNVTSKTLQGTKKKESSSDESSSEDEEQQVVPCKGE